MLAEHWPCYSRIPPALVPKLDALTVVFAAEKDFVGCGGLTVTPPMKLAPSRAQRLPADGRARRPAVRVTALGAGLSVAVRGAGRMHDENGVVTEESRVLAGESWDVSRVILSWEDVDSRGAPGEAYNVVFHEFAHYLDHDSGGAPWIEGGDARRRWMQLLDQELERLRAQAEAGERSSSIPTRQKTAASSSRSRARHSSRNRRCSRASCPRSTAHCPTSIGWTPPPGSSSLAPYTCAVFHFPRVNSHSVKRPTDVSEMNTPQNTPECCQSSADREQPRQRDLDQPEEHDVDPGRRDRVAGTVERLHRHHPPAVDEQRVRQDPEPLGADRDHRRVVGEDAHELARQREEQDRHREQVHHVVRADAPHRGLGAPGLRAPRFWPTSVAAAFDMPQAGIIVNIMMRIAIVAPATASLPMPARMRIRKIHDVIATIIWPMPPSEVRTMFHRIAAVPGAAANAARAGAARRGTGSRAASARRRRGRSSSRSPRPRRRAPGSGRSRRSGSGRARCSRPFATHSTRIAAAASPAPRKIALIVNSSMITALPPSTHCMYG